MAAISPDGAVWPCVFSRWLPAGSVLDAELAAILTSVEATRIRGELATAFAARTGRQTAARRQEHRRGRYAERRAMARARTILADKPAAADPPPRRPSR